MRWCLCCLFSKKDVYDPYEEFDSSSHDIDSSSHDVDSSSQDSYSSSQASTVNTLHTILLLDNQ